MSEPLHEKITRLAEDLSLALAEHDDGLWGLDIRPAHKGRPIFALTRDDISARLRIQMYCAKMNAALREGRPDWETHVELERGYLLFARPDADLSPLAVRIAGDGTVSVRAT